MKRVCSNGDPPSIPVNRPLGFTNTVMAGKTDNVTVKTHVTHEAITQIYIKKKINKLISEVLDFNRTVFTIKDFVKLALYQTYA